MKNYAKVVQAVQFLGDVKVLKDILDKKDVITVGIEAKEVILFRESNNSSTGYWRLKETDYVTKEDNIITVYKKEKFEKDFDEVLMEDVVNQDVKEIKVKEAEVVKTEKKSASQVVDKGKKE